MNKDTVFKCQKSKCLKCCCGPFSGVSDKLVSLDKRLFSEIVLTDEDYCSLIENGYSEYISNVHIQKQKDYKKLITSPDGTCVAYVDGKCLIYNFRPTICRAFPFYIDAFAGLCVINCPGVFLYSNNISSCREFIEAARRMYAFWLNFYK